MAPHASFQTQGLPLCMCGTQKDGDPLHAEPHFHD